MGDPTWDLIWAIDGYAPDRPDLLHVGSGPALRQTNFTERWLDLQPGAAPLEAYERAARRGAYEPPDSSAHLAPASNRPPALVAPLDARGLAR